MTRAEGIRSILVTAIVVLAAPIAVTGLAVAGISVGDAIETLGNSAPEDDATGDEAGGSGVAATDVEARAPTSPSAAPRVETRDVGRARALRPDARARTAEAPGAPAAAPVAVEPPVPAIAPDDGAGTDVPDPGEPAPPAEPVDELDDPLVDPLDGAGDTFDDVAGGLLP